MSMEFDAAETLDVSGAACPIPVVKTKQSVDDLAAGEVLAVVATDPGSVSDIAGWAESTAGVELLAQREDEEGGRSVYRHYVRAIDE